MKRLLPAIVLTLLIVAGCQKRPINGPLDGMWQIMTIEYPHKATIVPDQYYFNLYRHTTNLSHAGGLRIGGNMTYDRSADSLILEYPYKGTWLGPVGVETHTPYTFRFKILHLSNKRLVMALNDTITYTCRKF